MLILLQLILCAIKAVAWTVGFLLVTVLNLLVFSIGGLAQLVVLLLPDMPSAPSPPSGGITGALNWLVPIGPLVGGLAVFVILWGSFMVLKIALKWVKAL